jgi:hypothetical protein
MPVDSFNCGGLNLRNLSDFGRAGRDEDHDHTPKFGRVRNVHEKFLEPWAAIRFDRHRSLRWPSLSVLK